MSFDDVSHLAAIVFRVILGRCASIELWCAIAHLRISRFRVQGLRPCPGMTALVSGR